MALAVLYSRAVVGMDAPLVTVEVHLANGLPNFTIVGLAETAVKESKDRVRAAIQNARLDFPSRRITVNLAPADLPKEGGRFDLPIAIGILAASGQIPKRDLAKYEFAGELALTGALRNISGALATVLGARDSGRDFVLPAESAAEGSLVDTANVLGADSLLAVCAHLCGRQPLNVATHAEIHTPPTYPDLSDVKGQSQAKRALEIAAAGGHSLLMTGPPGSGKSMLAERLPGILPPMSNEEALACAALQSIGSGGFRAVQWKRRPFRAPHHSASGPALVGGGAVPKPGEISLASHGVLFLDELPEFDRNVLEMLREPLESGRITISRAARQTDFPARFQLVAAMNPCPCGYSGHQSSRCHCTPDMINRYRRRISGPLLDRLDLQIEVAALAAEDLSRKTSGEPSELVRRRVLDAYSRQMDRQGKVNAALEPRVVEYHCNIEGSGWAFLSEASTRLGLSARGFHRILKVARTIADLEALAGVGVVQIAEAIQLRRLMVA